MKKLYQTWPFNFGAIHKQDFKKAKVVIVPVPYDGTDFMVSYHSGSRNGPYAIILNSRYMDELLEDENQENLVDFKSTDIFTLDEIELSKNSPKEAIEGVSQAVSDEVLKYNKIPFLLGGEHSITLGAALALKKKYPDLSILQLDAHTDLMQEFESTLYSHACVMRRIMDLGIKTSQIGIRNINLEIKNYIKEKKLKSVYFAPYMPPVKKVLNDLTKNVYLTIDLDVFDPSIMPAVCSPEPGGLGWYEVLDLIEKVAQERNIVGVDVVELSPIAGIEAPNFLAAKLVYKIISYIFLCR